jgi:hypothetical protein
VGFGWCGLRGGGECGEEGEEREGECAVA